MPQFKIRTTDGEERLVVARRVVRHHSDTIFETPAGTSWRAICRMPSAEIESVRRRVVEFNGLTRWINEPTVQIAATATR